MRFLTITAIFIIVCPLRVAAISISQIIGKEIIPAKITCICDKIEEDEASSWIVPQLFRDNVTIYSITDVTKNRLDSKSVVKNYELLQGQTIVIEKLDCSNGIRFLFKTGTDYYLAVLKKKIKFGVVKRTIKDIDIQFFVPSKINNFLERVKNDTLYYIGSSSDIYNTSKYNINDAQFSWHKNISSESLEFVVKFHSGSEYIKTQEDFEHFSSLYVNKEELIALSIAHYSREHVDSLKQYLGKEYFEPWVMGHTFMYNSDKDKREDQYYKATELLLLPSQNTRPYLNYYLKLEGEHETIAFECIPDMEKYLTDANEHRAMLAKETEERARADAEYAAMLAKDEQDYLRSLTKRFGASNAKLIIKRQVIIGMTKAMCEESWGTPNAVSTTIYQNGEVEAWIYNNQCLYFKGNKLIAMQDISSY